PFVVFEDVGKDGIPAAVDGLLASKFRNAGQTCVCTNRVYVHESLYDEFARQLVEKVQRMSVGHGVGVTSGSLDLGPLITPAAVEKVDRLVKDALDKGADLAVGGGHENGFYAPTVLLGMTDEMAITGEEIFGPVAALYRFSSEDEVVRRAND